MPKKSGRGGKNVVQITNEDESHIVFGNAKASKKKEEGRGQGNNDRDAVPSTSNTQIKPDTRTLIGGASWTGKLPVNLLSEHCQKQKWAKPEYTMNHNADGFSSMVILKATNSKTKEIVTLPSFKLPPTMKHLAVQPSAVEARHFAATYALFRVCSMRNIHMMLPPTWRDLWKNGFQEQKAIDVKEGRGWMYEADPFAALEQKEEAQRIAAKKKEEREKQMARDAANPVVSLANRTGLGDGARSNTMKGWAKAPKVELGKQIRRDTERLVRQHAGPSSQNHIISQEKRLRLVREMAGLGFRESHAEEALEECCSREEVLEWLLIYVPEDDLPKWALPEGYSAGVTMASSNLKREATVMRLAEGGYARELCSQMLDDCEGNEGKASERLQQVLIDQARHAIDAEAGVSKLSLDYSADPEIWNEEQATLEAIYGPRYRQVNPDVISIELDFRSEGSAMLAKFRKSSRYPASSPVLAVLCERVPAYIKLSIIQQAFIYVNDSLIGESMISAICDWLESNVANIVENPGRLRSVNAATSGPIAAPSTRLDHSVDRRGKKPFPVNWKTGAPESIKMLAQYQQRLKMPQQQSMLKARMALPAWQLKNDIIDAVTHHQVTIVAGETGSGKSTQAVQFILDDMICHELGAAANIICTQPRRISALGLADRVSAERCSPLGGEVGYAIRGEAKHSIATKITFVTTGVLLRRLQTSGEGQEDVIAALADVSHIIVDEVHERSLDVDFLLVLLKEVLRERKDLRVVLMSATLDAQIFKDYFRDVGMVTIKGRTFSVDDYYLDDVVRLTGFRTPSSKPRMDDDVPNEQNNSVASSIMNLGMAINYELIRSLVEEIDLNLGSATGGILIFLPGTMEINRTLNALRTLPQVHSLPLHASLTPAEQRRVFPPAPAGKRKVIAATNVAETSITIEDIIAVIDTGKVKETSFDVQSNMVKLQEVWATKAACKQRRGRAGRVRAGQCFKLYTHNAESKMAERPEPEIRRVPLEQLCLSVKAMGTADVSAFLASALTPPESLAIEGAIALLHRIGALDGDQMTALGRHLSMIPADLRCGKLIVFGAIFGCLEACVTVAAILTGRSPFLSPQGKLEESKAARTTFASGHGDLICDLRAFEEWSKRRQASNPRELRFWCDDNFLSTQTLNDISSNRAQYMSSLAEIGFIPNEHLAAQGALNARNDNTALIRALIAGSFSPQIARIDFPDKKYAASVSGAVELDPEARTIKYFNEENGRVFIHPSSTMFDAQSFPGSSVLMAYFTKMATSKVFIRQLTPFNAYSLLLFGGKIEFDTLGRGLVIDGWLRVRGWSRIGVLVRRVRRMLDDVLAKKIEDPGVDISGNEVVDLARRLVEFDGLDR